MRSSLSGRESHASIFNCCNMPARNRKPTIVANSTCKSSSTNIIQRGHTFGRKFLSLYVLVTFTSALWACLVRAFGSDMFDVKEDKNPLPKLLMSSALFLHHFPPNFDWPKSVYIQMQHSRNHVNCYEIKFRSKNKSFIHCPPINVDVDSPAS